MSPFNPNLVQNEVTPEWNVSQSSPVVYVSGPPVQQQEVGIQSSGQFLFDDHDVQKYDDLVKSPFIEELCSEIDQWSNDPYFVQEMETEKAHIAKEYSNNEMITFDDIDLFEFCNV